MQSIIVTLVAFLAATGVAVPVSVESRQLGAVGTVAGTAAPILQQAGKHAVPAVQRLEGSLDPKQKTTTTPGKNETKKKSDPLSSITGLLGGLVPGGLVPGI